MTRIWEHLAEWIAHRRTLNDVSIGFVPTMGALHHGHASLVRRSTSENAVTVVSLFVNPTQFNDPKDFDRYPRTRGDDLALLESLGVNHVIMPTVGDLYPNGYRFRIEEDRLTQLMEGVRRPGHLQAVMTIVLKLLNLVGAGRAYFGEKDYQQLQIIRDMAGDFFIPTEIVGCPIMRETSGLAASSRNALLSEQGRKQAALIVSALRESASPEAAAATLLNKGFTVEYVEDYFERRFAAVWLECIRLIDNVPLNGKGNVHAPLS